MCVSFLTNPRVAWGELKQTQVKVYIMTYPDLRSAGVLLFPHLPTSENIQVFCMPFEDSWNGLLTAQTSLQIPPHEHHHGTGTTFISLRQQAWFSG